MAHQPLERIRIPKPCHQDWESMPGDSSQRFCDSCQHSVRDLSTLTRKQIEHLVTTTPRGICGRIACDQTGKMIFQPETQPAWRLMLRASLLGISACASHVFAAPVVKSCSVELRVVDVTDASVAAARVTFYLAGKPGAAFAGVSDARGFVSQLLDAGRYRLQVEKSGFSSYAQDVDLTCADESPKHIDVQLQIGLMGAVVLIQPPPTNPFVLAWLRMRDLFWP